ncbi:MAG: hypothetical protein AAGN35_00265 [Bacteroidota bacterium]
MRSGRASHQQQWKLPKSTSSRTHAVLRKTTRQARKQIRYPGTLSPSTTNLSTPEAPIQVGQERERQDTILKKEV